MRDVKNEIIAVIKEMVLPELAVMRQEQVEIKSTLALTNKRLDDVNAHMLDQSRRLDAIREELSTRIDETNKRIDETNDRMDRMAAGGPRRGVRRSQGRHTLYAASRSVSFC